MADPLHAKLIVAKLFEGLGGRQNAISAFEAEAQEITRIWNQDLKSIGRIPRAHLFVEYFMERYLKAINPSLGSLKAARLSFSQKIELLDRNYEFVSELLPGLRCLNSVRNRLAHTLSAEVTEKDRLIFVHIECFRAYLYASGGKRNVNRWTKRPIDALESFSRFAGVYLGSPASPTSAVLESAIKEASAAAAAERKRRLAEDAHR